MPAEVPTCDAPREEPEPEPPNRQPLRRLGSYELLRQLARGGMADIYLARRDGIGSFERHVVLKVLNRHRAKDAEACQMFLDEARVTALLNHHNIAAVLDVGVVAGQHYLAMEYVHGVDLRELLAASARKRVAVPYETALSMVAGAAAGLDHAHRRLGPDGQPLCLVHRDISLSNVMVGHDGSVKVIDFGIAQTAIATVHTSPGTVRGKASYMSPEQCLGDPVDQRTDVFALGIVLYELTTGARCFSGKNDFERMLGVVRGEFIPPSQLVASYPPALEQVALAQGWVTGTHTIARLLRELFGEVAEPWAAPPVDPIAPAIAVAPPTTRGHRLARGTQVPLARGSDPDLLRSCASAPDEPEDDEPTRGRRAVRRPPTAPLHITA